MADCETVIAFGAGGLTKIVDGDRIERVANYKYPYEYISNFETILARKKQVLSQLENQC